MKCEICRTGERRDQLIRYSLALDDRLVVVEHVPAQVCDQCGETTLQPDVVKRLQKTISHPGAPARIVETPVYEFA